jgi:uncharacterized protein (TIGR02231 family)
LRDNDASIDPPTSARAFQPKDLRMRNRCSTTGLLAFAAASALGLVAVSATAADVIADARIERVTVYRQGATVTRFAEVAVPAGTQRLIFRGLPADVDPETLQVSVANPGVQLGGIELARINEANFVSEPERDLRHRIEEAGDQEAVLKDEIATAQNQLKLLDSLAANPGGSPNKAGVDSANLAAVLGTMATGEVAARKRIREATVQIRAIDARLEQLKADLAKIATTSKQSTEVRAAVVANASLTAAVAVSYRIASAGWEWIYQARLDTTAKQLRLDRQASVTQGSGEDWKNVELNLTTALPNGDVATPALQSVFVDFRAPQLQVNSVYNKSVAAPAAAAAAGMPAQEMVVTGSRRQRAEAVATEYVADYHVPARVTVLADRQARLFPIGQNAFDVALVARIVPSADPQAHLEASFKYTDALPIEAGQLALYRDGAYVGAAETAAFLPGADVRMPFGIDDRIRVAIRDEATQSGQKGLLSRQSVRETRQRIDVTNYHPTAIAVEVLDRIPVSKNADIRVEFLNGATEPTIRDFEGKAGVLLWKLEPAPQQTLSVHQAYSIQYPAGRQLQETEGSANRAE